MANPWDMGRSPSSFPTQTTDFDVNTRRVLDGESTFDDSSPRFEDWSPAKQRAAYEGLQRSDGKLATINENAAIFLANHPEFLDTKANGKVMNSTLKAMFGDVVHTPEQFQAAYNVAHANNLLEVDKAEIVKQQQAAANQRAKAERGRIVNLTEEELESMSLEDIRRLDAVENQRRMQQAGERGGNGW